jgi:hypothetical protein
MGFGWRVEHTFRAEGELTVDGSTRAFKAVGNRVRRQSVRPLGAFRGHCWQAAVFPDGRAFGFEARPVHDDGFEPWNEGFVFVDGRMHRARAINPRWLGDIVPRGEDVSVELHSDLGVTRIRGTTELSTFRIAGNEMWGLNLHQGGVRYLWDGQEAYGMIERSMPTARSATLDRRG